MTTFVLAAAVLLAMTLALMLRPVAARGPVPRAWKTSAALAVAVPIAASALYAALGNPQALDPQAQAAAEPHAQPAEIERMVSEFAKKMEANPGDAKGWALLARSYKAMNRTQDAANAYERAMPAIRGDADELANYADVAATLADGRFPGKPQELIDLALKADPQHPMSLWLAGTADLQRGDYRRAIDRWQKLRALLPAGSEDAREIEGALADARARAGLPVEIAKPQAAAAPAGASVSGTVELDASLRPAPQDIVMVIARVPGTRMPLAVMRARASELPLAFKLDDSLAMTPEARISGVKEVEVEARVSKSGQAVPQAGDFMSAAQTVAVGATGLKLRVDKVR